MKTILTILAIVGFSVAAYAGSDCCPSKSSSAKADKVTAKDSVVLAKADAASCPYASATKATEKSDAACSASKTVAKADASCGAASSCSAAKTSAVAADDSKKSCDKEGCCPTDGTACTKDCCKEKAPKVAETVVPAKEESKS